MAIHLSDSDKINLAIMAGYCIGIAILWRTPVLKYILYPFKALTIVFHELGHAGVACCSGGKVKSIEVDPELGGVTYYSGGVECCILPAGYLGSAFVGSVLVFCGWDLTASKVASIVLMLMLLLSIYLARNWLTRILSLVFCVGIGLLWWPANGEGLRYVVLFVGVMSGLYSVWDIVEDLVVRRVNASDAAKFAAMSKCCPAQVWGLIWCLISLAFLAGAATLAILAF